MTREDLAGADQADVEHQAADLALGSNASPRERETAGQQARFEASPDNAGWQTATKLDHVGSQA
jgi:hypothetical protein